LFGLRSFVMRWVSYGRSFVMRWVSHKGLHDTKKFLSSGLHDTKKFLEFVFCAIVRMNGNMVAEGILFF
jgi:hypothetical protein